LIGSAEDEFLDSRVDETQNRLTGALSRQASGEDRFSEAEEKIRGGMSTKIWFEQGR
jgi:hypothetical protein